MDDEKTGADRMARFVSRFTKERNSGRPQAPIEWTFQSGPDCLTRISHKEADKLAIFRQWIESGLNTATDIATEMGVTKGTVSKMSKVAQQAGWLISNGRHYSLVS